eukprot:tig00020614_g12206.t1
MSLDALSALWASDEVKKEVKKQAELLEEQLDELRSAVMRGARAEGLRELQNQVDLLWNVIAPHEGSLLLSRPGAPPAKDKTRELERRLEALERRSSCGCACTRGGDHARAEEAPAGDGAELRAQLEQLSDRVEGLARRDELEELEERQHAYREAIVLAVVEKIEAYCTSEMDVREGAAGAIRAEAAGRLSEVEAALRGASEAQRALAARIEALHGELASESGALRAELHAAKLRALNGQRRRPRAGNKAAGPAAALAEEKENAAPAGAAGAPPAEEKEAAGFGVDRKEVAALWRAVRELQERVASSGAGAAAAAGASAEAGSLAAQQARLEAAVKEQAARVAALQAALEAPRPQEAPPLARRLSATADRFPVRPAPEGQTRLAAGRGGPAVAGGGGGAASPAVRLRPGLRAIAEALLTPQPARYTTEALLATPATSSRERPSPSPFRPSLALAFARASAPGAFSPDRSGPAALPGPLPFSPQQPAPAPAAPPAFLSVCAEVQGVAGAACALLIACGGATTARPECDAARPELASLVTSLSELFERGAAARPGGFLLWGRDPYTLTDVLDSLALSGGTAGALVRGLREATAAAESRGELRGRSRREVDVARLAAFVRGALSARLLDAAFEELFTARPPPLARTHGPHAPVATLRVQSDLLAALEPLASAPFSYPRAPSSTPPSSSRGPGDPHLFFVSLPFRATVPRLLRRSMFKLKFKKR